MAFAMTKLPTLISICDSRNRTGWTFSAPMITDWLNYPHLFVLGCLMDRNIPAKKAWDIPFIVAADLGSKDFSAFESKNLTYYQNLFNNRRLHRYNSKMAKVFYDGVQKIKNDYHGNAANIWNKTTDAAVIVSRFLQFNGVGKKISSMAVNILQRDLGVKITTGMNFIDISADIHVKRTVYRLGLLNYTHKNGQV